jgi:hypothetical protein
MGNRNGLNHKLRGFKGIGWNRALPPAFGFDKAIHPDGIDDYLTVPGIIGKPIPDQFTVEFWVKYPVVMGDFGSIFRISAFGNKDILSSRNYQTDVQTVIASEGGSWNTTLPSDTRKTMLCYTLDLASGTITLYQPSTLPRTEIKSMLPSRMGLTFETFDFFRVGGFGIGAGSAILDEFRVYKKNLSHETFKLNYNNGVGSNPWETENLLLWYKFEQFEMLDFSDLQDASDIKLGIRDLTGNHYHACPFNLDSNPSSPNYVLKTF